MYDMTPYLMRIDEVIAKGPYSDNWHSLSTYSVLPRTDTYTLQP